jgi:Na+/H+ antiporter NhaD/arsenite permease-like protein
MTSILSWLRKDKVFLMSIIVSIMTMFFVTPSFDYFTYMNWHVLIVMFSIMIAIGGIFQTHFFDYVATKLVMQFQTLRHVSLMILLSTFFLGMLLTNDVVLLTLIPFTVFILKHLKEEHYTLKIIALQAIAANMGSALTPMGDPQNIYIYAFYQPEFLDFLGMTFPITLTGLVLLFVLNRVLIPQHHVQLNITTADIKWSSWSIYMSILLVALLGILRIIPLHLVLLYSLGIALVVNRSLFQTVDYHLLFTFVSFFIITGNISQIELIVVLFEPWLQNGFQIYSFSLLLSQVISNVPAAVLLSTFVSQEEYGYLLQGVNVGALGSIIGSLASLIALKYITIHQPGKVRHYIKIYFLMSLVFMMTITFLIWVV